MKICFLDKTNFEYNSNDINSYKLRGAETLLINLANELSILGHDILVINNCYKNEILNGVEWKNINSYNQNETFDIAISNIQVKKYFFRIVYKQLKNLSEKNNS